MSLRYSVIVVPHHPGSWRQNLSWSKTYHVIDLERRPSSPNSDTTQSPYCSRCLSILFYFFYYQGNVVFGTLNTTRIILTYVGTGRRLVNSVAPDTARRLHAVPVKVRAHDP